MAARKLFIELGYDASTLRKIAEAAGLGSTTLFNHISDKRDLIYLIFEEEVVLTAERSQAAIRPWQTFTEKILTSTALYFQMFSVEPVLSRILFSEVIQRAPSSLLERHLHVRNQLIAVSERLALEAQAAEELRPELDAKVIARAIQFAFTGASRWWITEPNPDWRTGQKYFEEILTLIAEGYQCKPAAVESISQKSTRARRGTQ